MSDGQYQTALDLLCSRAKLERDAGSSRLALYISESIKTGNSIESLINKVLDGLKSFEITPQSGQEWECAFGMTHASQQLVASRVCDQAALKVIAESALRCIVHWEFRVRIAAGQVLGAICQYEGAANYLDFKEALVTQISENLKRDIPEESFQRPHIKDASEIFHDTAGWKNLETSMKALQAVIDGCGPAFLAYVTQELLDLIFSTLDHTNRFVRETGYYLCASLAHYNVASLKEHHSGNRTALAMQIAQHLASGLSDNWSQVRLAASTATRYFFDGMSDDDRELFLPLLLPGMCLNRYYLAEGVRIYNQETWRLVVGEKGRQLVEKYIDLMVAFYISQTQCDNHAVREAACHCMTELACKVDAMSVAKHIPSLLDALHCCFKDDSWPVRDTACVACGKFIAAFPDECRDLLKELYPLFFANLSDPIPSVRQGAALALADVAIAYRAADLKIIVEHVRQGLDSITEQKENIEKYGGLEKGPGDFGVIKHLRDNDITLHSDQQMYSCGSLAPKMGKGGCSDHTFRRPSQPWEKTDGCVLLLAALCDHQPFQNEALLLFPGLVQALRHQGYSQRDCLLETFCSAVPGIAKSIGKRQFKSHLESFLDPLHDAFYSTNALTASAARNCMEQMAHFLGPNILRGRLEQYNPSYVSLCDGLAVHP